MHVPGTDLFVGEPVLALGLVLAALSVESRRVLSFSTPVRALVGFMAWGLLLLLLDVGEWGMDAVQDSALWYYGLFALVVATLVLARPDTLDRVIPLYAGALAVFALFGWVRLAMYQDVGGQLPDSLVPWTSHRPGNIAIHTAMGFAFMVLVAAPWLVDRLGRTSGLVITASTSVALLVLFMGAGTQNRGGLAAGLLIIFGVPLLARRFGPAIAAFFVAVVVVLGILYATGVSVDLGTAGRDLSVRQIIDNLVSIGGGEDRDRIDFWSPVIDDVFTQEHFLNGLGFGENLGDRYGFEDLRPQNAYALRNLHNSQLTVLARMGIVGAALWLATWIAWYYHLFRARARLRLADSPRRAAFLSWAMLAALGILVNSLFDGTLEGPQVAIWMWSVFGLGSAIALETNIREWRRRRAGVRDLTREGGQDHPLDMSLRRLKRASRWARVR